MSAEDNKAVIQRWVETWNRGRVDVVPELVTGDYVRHDPNSPEVRGPEAEKQLVRMYLAAFPDLHFTIEDHIAEGDKVVVRLSARHAPGRIVGHPADRQAGHRDDDRDPPSCER